MKHLKNQKGSIPLVLTIVFMIGMSTMALAGLLLSGKATYKYSVTSDLERLYENDSIIEMTINITKQVLDTKEWEYVKYEDVIKDVDLFKIEDIVNATLIPLYIGNGKIYLEEIYFPPRLDYYCEEEVDSNEELVGFNCLKEALDIEFKIIIENRRKTEEYILSLQEIYPKVSKTNDYIYLDLQDYKVKLRR